MLFAERLLIFSVSSINRVVQLADRGPRPGQLPPVVFWHLSLDSPALPVLCSSKSIGLWLVLGVTLPLRVRALFFHSLLSDRAFPDINWLRHVPSDIAIGAKECLGIRESKLDYSSEAAVISPAMTPMKRETGQSVPRAYKHLLGTYLAP